MDHMQRDGKGFAGMAFNGAWHDLCSLCRGLGFQKMQGFMMSMDSTRSSWPWSQRLFLLFCFCSLSLLRCAWKGCIEFNCFWDFYPSFPCVATGSVTSALVLFTVFLECTACMCCELNIWPSWELCQSEAASVAEQSRIAEKGQNVSHLSNDIFVCEWLSSIAHLSSLLQVTQ